jgi:PPM family protein phosphatase
VNDPKAQSQMPEQAQAAESTTTLNPTTTPPETRETPLPATDEASPDVSLDLEEGVYTLDDDGAPDPGVIQALVSTEAKPLETAFPATPATTAPTAETAFPELPPEGALEDASGGFLEEEILEPSGLPTAFDPANDLPESLMLESGAYSLTKRESIGRALAKSPIGEEVRVVLYSMPSETARGLYPHPMLPILLDAGQHQNKLVLTHPKLEGRTLEQAFSAGDREAMINAIVDIARINRYLHARGFALVSVEPREVLLEPTRLLRLPSVYKIGDAAPAEAQRYAAPERASGASISGIEGVYTIGLLLYHALTGRLPTEGEVIAQFPEIPGAPQALTAMLAPTHTRADPGEALELSIKLQKNLEKRLRWVIGCTTTVGINPDRTTNEDSVGYRVRRSLGHRGDTGFVVACVADGMGGMAKGEDASQAAVSGFLDFPLNEVSKKSVLEAAALANARVIGALEGKSGGCTFTGFIAEGDQIAMAHVGDTRAYLVTDTVKQISDDHSMVAMFVKMGIITPEAAHNHPDSNKVMRAMGSNRDLPPDYVDTTEMTVPPEARIIIVSDGVWGVFPPEEFAKLLLEPLLPQDLADRLVKTALDRTTQDNATALVMHLEERLPL